MQIRYVGPSDHVQIAATGQVVERGKTVEVSAELGKALAKQEYWKTVTKTKKEKE